MYGYIEFPTCKFNNNVLDYVRLQNIMLDNKIHYNRFMKELTDFCYNLEYISDFSVYNF